MDRVGQLALGVGQGAGFGGGLLAGAGQAIHLDGVRGPVLRREQAAQPRPAVRPRGPRGRGYFGAGFRVSSMSMILARPEPDDLNSAGLGWPGSPAPQSLSMSPSSA